MCLPKILSLGAVMVGIVLAGCVEKLSDQEAAIEALSRQLRPEDTATAAIYDRSCRNCHTIAATGAPLTGMLRAGPYASIRAWRHWSIMW